MKFKNLKLNKVPKLIEWLTRGLIFYFFLIHGIDALKLDQIMLMYFKYLGFSLGISKFFLILVGLLDLTIAGLVIFKPFRILAIWTIIWPIIPATVDYLLFRPDLVNLVKYLIMHCTPGIVFYLLRFSNLSDQLSNRKKRGKSK